MTFYPVRLGQYPELAYGTERYRHESVDGFDWTPRSSKGWIKVCSIERIRVIRAYEALHAATAAAEPLALFLDVSSADCMEDPSPPLTLVFSSPFTRRRCC